MVTNFTESFVFLHTAVMVFGIYSGSKVKKQTMKFHRQLMVPAIKLQRVLFLFKRCMDKMIGVFYLMRPANRF